MDSKKRCMYYMDINVNIHNDANRYTMDEIFCDSGGFEKNRLVLKKTSCLFSFSFCKYFFIPVLLVCFCIISLLPPIVHQSLQPSFSYHDLFGNIQVITWCIVPTCIIVVFLCPLIVIVIDTYEATKVSSSPCPLKRSIPDSDLICCGQCLAIIWI